VSFLLYRKIGETMNAESAVGLTVVGIGAVLFLMLIVAGIVRAESRWLTCSKCQHHFNGCGDRTLLLPSGIPEPLLTGICDECRDAEQANEFQDRPSSRLGNNPSKERRVSVGNGRF